MLCCLSWISLVSPVLGEEEWPCVPGPGCVPPCMCGMVLLGSGVVRAEASCTAASSAKQAAARYFQIPFHARSSSGQLTSHVGAAMLIHQRRQHANFNVSSGSGHALSNLRLLDGSRDEAVPKPFGTWHFIADVVLELSCGHDGRTERSFALPSNALHDPADHRLIISPRPPRA